MIDPKDREAAIIELATAVDRAEQPGRSAHGLYHPYLRDAAGQVRGSNAAGGAGLVVPTLAPGSGDNAPASCASRGLVKIQAVAEQLQPR